MIHKRMDLIIRTVLRTMGKPKTQSEMIFVRREIRKRFLKGMPSNAVVFPSLLDTRMRRYK